METQNKMFTIHRTFNVEYTEVNLDSRQTVWHFCLEKYLSISGILATKWKKSTLFLIVLFCLIFMVWCHVVALKEALSGLKKEMVARMSICRS